MKKYDGLFIFAAMAKDEVLDTQIEKASAEITRLSGKVLGVDALGKKVFARPMNKRDSGVYVKIRFEMAPAQVAALKARYQLLEDFFRVQILVVDDRREAVIAQQAEQERIREATREATREAARAAAEAERTAASQEPAGEDNPQEEEA